MSSIKQSGGVNPLDNLKPMPDSIKYGLMGLLALVLIVLWFVFSSGDSDDSQAQTLVDIETPAQNLEPEIDSQDPIINPIEPFSENKHEAKLTDESDLPFVNQVQENELKLTTLENQLNQLILDNDVHQQQQDSLIQQLQEQLTAQAVQIEQLQTHLKARQLVAKSNKKNKRYVTTKLPFALVSIDQWGNELYAVLRLQGQLHELRNGQELNGWQLYSFDHLRRTVVFKNKAGIRKELSVKSYNKQ